MEENRNIDKAEQNRLLDLKNRDEFAERLQMKNNATQKFVESGNFRLIDAAVNKLKSEEFNQKELTQLRILSRRKYLEKRKDDKVSELEADINDDEYLFEDTVLSSKEREDREYKRQVLIIAKEHEKARELQHAKRYHIPKDNLKGDTENHFQIDEGERYTIFEQQTWESEQIALGRFQFGAKDAKTSQEYQLLLGSQIEFMQSLPDNFSIRKTLKSESDVDRKRLSIRDTKISLPVYPFKEDIIAALHDHQVNTLIFE